MQISTELEEHLQGIAHVACEVPSLREDFLQEMRLALLDLPPGQRIAWYLSRAKSRAIDWLRRELGRHRGSRTGQPSSGSVGWELVARLPELFDQDRAVLAANLGWE